MILVYVSTMCGEYLESLGIVIGWHILVYHHCLLIIAKSSKINFLDNHPINPPFLTQGTANFCGASLKTLLFCTTEAAKELLMEACGR